MPTSVTPEDTMKMLRLREEGDMSYEEIAEELDLSKPTVIRHTKEAQEVLKRRKREYDEDVRDLRESNEELKEELATLKTELDEFKEKERSPFHGNLSRTEDGQVVLKTKEVSGENYRRLLTSALQNNYADINEFIKEAVIPHMQVVSDFRNRFGRRLGPGLLTVLIRRGIQNPPSEGQTKQAPPTQQVRGERT